MTAERRYTLIGAAVLAALLAAVIAPDFRQGLASLAHPDPVGPTVYSKSAIGHLAFQKLLDQLGIATVVRQNGSGGYVSGDDVLVIAEPRTDDATLTDVKAMLTARRVLLVLPKRTGTADAHRPYWLGDDKLLAVESVERVLALVDEKATVVRGAALGGGRAYFDARPALSDAVQLMRSRQLQPLVGSADSMLVGEWQSRTGRVVVVSDPDLIANFNLEKGDNAVLAVNLIEHLEEDGGGTVVFDEFIHGFSEKPFQILGILFQFPFVLVTAQLAAAVGLALWAATARFGAPTPLAPPLEAGKRSLIDTATRLVGQSGRLGDLAERYREEMVRDTGRRLRAPAGLAPVALAAWLETKPGAPALERAHTPAEVWRWRKELLGEPGRDSQPY